MDKPCKKVSYDCVTLSFPCLAAFNKFTIFIRNLFSSHTASSTSTARKFKQKSTKSLKEKRSSEMFSFESITVFTLFLVSVALTITLPTRKSFTWNITELRDLICTRKLRASWKGKANIKFTLLAFSEFYSRRLFFFVSTDRERMEERVSWEPFVRRARRIKAKKKDRFCLRFFELFSVFHIRLRLTRTKLINILMKRTQNLTTIVPCCSRSVKTVFGQIISGFKKKNFQ